MRPSQPLAYSIPGTRHGEGRVPTARTLFVRASLRRPLAAIRPTRLEAVFWGAALVIGGVQQWASVDVPSSMDLVSYLDVGDAWLHGHWKEAINGYWNPLYSWLLGLVIAIVRPTARFEYPTVEGLDFAIFCGTLLAFSWFLRAVRDAAGGKGDTSRPIPDWAWLVGGYTLFTWAAVRWITLSSNTPDMLGAALLFVAWGILLRLDEQERPASYIRLGIVLALAFLARTPLLIVAGTLIAVSFWQARTRERRRGLLISATLLVALSLPLIVAVSVARGHLTIGDNGRLNHAWLANPRPHVMPNRYWQGGPEGYGTPLHPVRVLWPEPAAYEFAKPIGGTYPPWTDPSYWYEGLTYRFDGTAEWTTARNNARFFWEMFGKWLLPVAVVLLLVGDPRATARAAWRNARYWMPPLVGLALYLVAADLPDQKMKLQPPQRYLAPFVVLLSIGFALSLRFRPAGWRRAAGRAGSALLVVASAALFWQMASASFAGLVDEDPAPPWLVARALEEAGVSRAMQVATIGSPDRHLYWARLSRVRIIADVPDDRAFWRESPEVRAAILDRLARVGVQAVVSWWLPPGDAASGWQRTAGTTYGVRRLAR